MHRLGSWLVAVLTALATWSAVAAPRDGLDVRLAVASPVIQGDVDVPVTVTVTNVARHPIHVLRWQLPDEELVGSLFKVTRDGQRVAYTGPLVKRTAPTAGDHVKLDPGETLTYVVELTSAYALDRNGRYTIEYFAGGTHGAGRPVLQSDALYLWLEGRSAKQVQAPPAPGTGKLSYTGNCSASQQTSLEQAVAAATTYANGAVTYLAQSPSATPRFVKWFGAFSTAGWNTARSHFVAVQDAFTTKDITLDCRCKKKTVYAYVYPTQPYKIYVCGAFWSAPMTGTDSKAGTLIHEMTHFDVVAGTEDYAYGQTAAASLAINNPAQALDNADNHEYFAENTPALP